MTFYQTLKTLFGRAGKSDEDALAAELGHQNRHFETGVIPHDRDATVGVERFHGGGHVDSKRASGGLRRTAAAADGQVKPAGTFVLSADAQEAGSFDDLGHICSPLVIEPGAFADWLEREAAAPDGWARAMVILTPNARFVATLQPAMVVAGKSHLEKASADDLAALAQRLRGYSGDRQGTTHFAVLIAEEEQTERAHDGVRKLINEANDLIFVSDLLLELAAAKKGKSS